MQNSASCSSLMTNLRSRFGALLLGFALLSCGIVPVAAQSAPVAQKPSAKNVVAKPKATPKKKAVTAPMPPPATPPAAPAPPEMPRWPVNERPASATIRWDSHGLRIEAANSSLQQILKEVSSLTGTQIEGLAKDERVFGSFGPGLARDVIAQLLHGTGYNVVMVGDQGQGAPRQIVLSLPNSGGTRAPGARPVSTTPDEDDDAAEPEPEPPPVNNPPPPGGAPRTPQQMMEEMRQRQQPEGGPPPNGNPPN